MKKTIKKAVIIVLGVLLLVLVVVGISFYRMTNRVDEAMYDEVLLDYDSTRDYIEVNSPNPVAHLIYYPGGLVEAESYLYQASLLAEAGIHVIIPKMPFNLAILNRDAFLDYYEADGLPWYIAGHSLGGASATYVVASDADKMAGLILLAAYPPASIDLSDVDIAVLSITANLDGVMDTARYEERKALLPQDTVFKEIAGGNHAQFGFYGTQRGDYDALISVHKQHEIITETIIEFIKEN